MKTRSSIPHIPFLTLIFFLSVPLPSSAQTDSTETELTQYLRKKLTETIWDVVTKDGNEMFSGYINMWAPEVSGAYLGLVEHHAICGSAGYFHKDGTFRVIGPSSFMDPKSYGKWELNGRILTVTYNPPQHLIKQCEEAPEDCEGIHFPPSSLHRFRIFSQGYNSHAAFSENYIGYYVSETICLERVADENGEMR